MLLSSKGIKFFYNIHHVSTPIIQTILSSYLCNSYWCELTPQQLNLPKNYPVAPPAGLESKANCNARFDARGTCCPATCLLPAGDVCFKNVLFFIEQNRQNR